MTTLIGSLLRKATRTATEPLNIITFPTHERYESLVAKTNHNFFGLQIPKWKTWNTTYEPVPNNYSILRGLPADLEFDLIFTLAKHQYQKAAELSAMLHLPLLCLEVFVPSPNVPISVIKESK